jgi:uncharacterized metal-binding protein YceD (DUF177 family)
MIIDLNTIKDEQEIRVSHAYDPLQCELEFDDWHYVEPVSLTALIHRQNDVLDITGALSSICRITCSRCLKEFDMQINEDLRLCLDISNKHQIDITDDIREQLILLHTQQSLCSDACKGLCHYCGHDLNISQCACSHDTLKTDDENGLFNQLNDIKDKFNDREKEK